MPTPKAPRDIVSRQLARSRKAAASSGFIRETYRMEREEARAVARNWFTKFPKAAYWTQVESWRVLDGDVIEFTMRRLPSAD